MEFDQHREKPGYHRSEAQQVTVTGTVPTRGPGRPVSTPTELESEHLHRIADLAIAILACLRRDNRSRYESERQLRAWLTAEIQFSSNDIDPALSLLAATGAILRPQAGLGHPRPGYLPGFGPEAPQELPARVKLGRLVLECIRGRSTVAEIAGRLEAADEDVPPEVLAEILQRLTDCGRIAMVQRQPAYPMRYVSRAGTYDLTDDLESSICGVPVVARSSASLTKINCAAG